MMFHGFWFASVTYFAFSLLEFAQGQADAHILREHVENCFVFLGATGDNALRDGGVWQGLFEAYASGAFHEAGGLDLYVAMNTPHTEAELRSKVSSILSGLYDSLAKNPGWVCKARGGDCTPETFVINIKVDIWPGRDANAQAASMAPSLRLYNHITIYLSIPPTIFGKWTKAAIDHWTTGTNSVHAALEKPFGTSLDNAQALHQEIIATGFPKENLHIVDHWLSFFINRRLLSLRSLVLPRLSASYQGWNSLTFERIAIVEHEERGLSGRGGFFDRVGQVRDMIQSHLLQELALALIDPETKANDLSAEKLSILELTKLDKCELGQYDGFLDEKKLGFHAGFADSTYAAVHLTVDSPTWKGVNITVTTGKEMGTTLYRLVYFQRNAPGVLIFDVGAEETGIGGVWVKDWPLVDARELEVPAPGFGDPEKLLFKPNVTAQGTGAVVDYRNSSLYFPRPYALMTASLLNQSYETAFVSYPECRKSWEVVTANSPSTCLDPSPDQVDVYTPPAECGQEPPRACWQNETVAYLYDVKFSCSEEHDQKYASVDLYRAKCMASATTGSLLFL